MDRTATAIPPIILLNVFHTCYPQFAEKGEGGVFQQQVRGRLFLNHLLSAEHYIELVCILNIENYIDSHTITYIRIVTSIQLQNSADNIT